MSANGHVTQEAITGIREDFNRLRGKLFEVIEVTGMPDQQQAAFKGIVRNLTYQAQADLESTIRQEGH